MKHASVVKLSELVHTQPDSVVSNTVLKKEKGNISFFAFDQGQGLSEHTAPFNAFVQVIEGEGTIVIDGKDFCLTEGEGIIMPANIPHAVQAKTDFKMMLVMIRE